MKSRTETGSWFFLGLLLCSSCVANADPVGIAVSYAGGPVPSTGAPLRIVASLQNADGVTDKKRFEILDRGEITVDLAPGDWHLAAEQEGFWSDGATVSTAGTGTRALARLELWPTGTVHGRLIVPANQEGPENVEAFFQPAPGLRPSNAVPDGHVTCLLEDLAWRCQLPAGVLDVQLLARGYIKEFRWDVEVKRGQRLDLGSIELRRGSAIRGWVVTEDGSASERVRVELRPRIAGQERSESARARSETGRASTTANHRGFFELHAVAPGDYVLSATQEPFGTATVTVRVLKDQVTEVADPPLTLRLPRTLEIYVDPPMVPDGRPWMVQLLRLDTGNNVTGVAADGPIPPDGSLQVEKLSVGSYFLMIGTADGETWSHQPVVVDSSATPVFVTLPILGVEGAVSFGGEPLAAKLYFGGRKGSAARALLSDDEGRFAGLLPRPGLWEIHVEADRPKISRSVQAEVVEGEPLEISLPATAVRGEVVDETGAGVEGALLRVTHLVHTAMSADLYTEREGRFEILGLPTGPTVLVAEESDRYSEEREVVLEEHRDAPPLRLVLRPALRLKGDVVDETGRGVSGARIKAVSVEVFHRPVFMVISDPDGGFELDLPAGTRNLILNVGAPGHGFRTLRTPASEDALKVVVSREHGTLVVELPAALDRTLWDAPQVVLLHNAGFAGLYFLQDWAGFHGQEPAEATSRYVIPEMEPGDYKACLVHLPELPALLAGHGVAPCVTGALPAFGELELSLSGADGV